MNCRSIIAVFLMMFAISSEIFAVDNNSGDDMVIRAGETMREDILKIGASVLVEGTAEKNIAVLGGDVTVKGRVKGDVVCLAGDILLLQGSVVDGDTVACFGQVKRNQGAMLNGEVVSINIKKEKVRGLITDMSSGMGKLHMSPLMVSMRITLLLSWLLVALFLTALFPSQTRRGVDKIKHSSLPILLTGLSSFIVFVILVVIFTILSFVLIGIPFLILTVVVVLALKAFGLTALFEFIGRWLSKVLKLNNPSPYVCVLFGWLFLGILKFIPYAGSISWLAVSIFALGTAVLTRFGTGGTTS